MTNLTPQPRVDKNGKTTVRWMKNNAPETAAKPLPIVSLTAVEPTINEQRSELCDILNRERYDADQNVESFTQYASDEVIASSLRFLRDTPDAGWQVAWLADREVEEDIIVDYLALYEVHEDSDDIEQTVSLLRGLHYDERNRGKLDFSDEDSLMRGKALLTFLQESTTVEDFSTDIIDYVAIEGKERFGWAIVHDATFDAVVNHPDRVDDIIEYVAERGKAGVELFNQRINEAPDPLVKGIL